MNFRDKLRSPEPDAVAVKPELESFISGITSLNSAITKYKQKIQALFQSTKI